MTEFVEDQWVRVKPDVGDHTAGGVGRVAIVSEGFVWVKFRDTVLPYAPDQLDDADDAAGFGHDVGVEIGQAAASFVSLVYRFSRKARWVDGVALVFLLLVLPCFGVWWRWPLVWFAVSFAIDMVTSWKLNPKRHRRAQS